MSNLKKCIKHLYDKNFKKAIEHGNLAITENPKSFEPYLCLGLSYRGIGEIEKAYQHFKKAEELVNNKEDLMLICDQIGQILTDIQKIDDAIFYYKRALNLAKELNQIEENTNILNNLAIAHIEKGEVEKAIEYYQTAVRLERNEKNLSEIYGNIGILYGGIGKYKKAIKYIEKTMKISEKYKNERSIMASKINLGSIFIEIGKYDKAEKILTEGIDLAKKIGDKYWQANGYWPLGVLYKKTGEKQKAEKYLKHALELFRAIGATADAQLVLHSMTES
jgi:tetratricopeptide (TPR) repeat protein